MWWWGQAPMIMQLGKVQSENVRLRREHALEQGLGGALPVSHRITESSDGHASTAKKKSGIPVGNVWEVSDLDY